jgi:hypothetical protein
LYLKKLNTLNLLAKTTSALVQTPFNGTYSEGGLSNTRSLDTFCGRLILLGGTGAVGGSSTALCSRKLNLSYLCSDIQLGSFAVTYCPFRK